MLLQETKASDVGHLGSRRMFDELGYGVVHSG